MVQREVSQRHHNLDQVSMDKMNDINLYLDV